MTTWLFLVPFLKQGNLRLPFKYYMKHSLKIVLRHMQYLWYTMGEVFEAPLPPSHLLYQLIVL